MNEDLYERLSRLLDGDLPPEEEAELHAQIRDDPEVAAAYQSLQQLVTRLDALPVELPAPPLTIRTSSWGPAGWGVAVAAIAALGLFSLQVPPQPQVVLETGRTHLIGDLQLIAADRPVHLEGDALFVIEPQETSMHLPSTAAGLVAGAALTITLYQGTATITGEPGEPTHVLHAGETQTYALGATKAHSTKPHANSQSLEERLAEAEAKLEVAEKKLQEASFSGALLRGQLSSLQGERSEWPENTPAAMRPQGFKAGLEKLLDGRKDVRVDWVDCDEYPCLASVEYLGDDPNQWMEDTKAMFGDWFAESMDDVSMSMSMSQEDDGDGLHTYGVIAGHEPSEEVAARTRFRMDELSQGEGQRHSEEEER